MKIEQKQIYHHYKLWEDYKNGFYKTCDKKQKELKILKVLEMFNSKILTEKYMNKVVNEWTYSCEQVFKNKSINKIAYLGQAACCVYAKVPNLITMYAWKFLSFEVQERSNKIAEKKILEWEQKQKLKNILKRGNKKDIQMGFQTKLLLN